MSATTKRSQAKVREEARRLYLTGEMSTNAEIAARLSVKPHTIGKWRREEDWDGLRSKIDIRAAEMFIEKIATDRTAPSDTTAQSGTIRYSSPLTYSMEGINPMSIWRECSRRAQALGRS